MGPGDRVVVIQRINRERGDADILPGHKGIVCWMDTEKRMMGAVQFVGRLLDYEIPADHLKVIDD